jgi:hypothetical protein
VFHPSGLVCIRLLAGRNRRYPTWYTCKPYNHILSSNVRAASREAGSELFNSDNRNSRIGSVPPTALFAMNILRSLRDIEYDLFPNWYARRLPSPIIFLTSALLRCNSVATSDTDSHLSLITLVYSIYAHLCDRNGMLIVGNFYCVLKG